jgi:hypothetical protein
VEHLREGASKRTESVWPEFAAKDVREDKET